MLIPCLKVSRMKQAMLGMLLRGQLIAMIEMQLKLAKAHKKVKFNSH